MYLLSVLNRIPMTNFRSSASIGSLRWWSGWWYLGQNPEGSASVEALQFQLSCCSDEALQVYLPFRRLCSSLSPTSTYIGQKGGRRSFFILDPSECSRQEEHELDASSPEQVLECVQAAMKLECHGHLHILEGKLELWLPCHCFGFQGFWRRLWVEELVRWLLQSGTIDWTTYI